MKVNFDGSYRDVQRLITARPVQNGVREDFSNMLASISPDKPQVADIPKEKDIARPPMVSQETPRARPNLAAPQLMK